MKPLLPALAFLTALASPSLLAHSAPVGPPPVPKLTVTITDPPVDAKNWINVPVDSRVTVKDSFGQNVTSAVKIQWCCTDGSYFDPFAAETVQVSPSFEDGGTKNYEYLVVARQNGATASSSPLPWPLPGERPMPPLSAKAAAPAATQSAAAMAQLELKSYNNMWRDRMGDPPPTDTAEFLHEVYAANHSDERDARVDHTRAALALRPGNPSNILLEFRMAVMLGQNYDPIYHEPPHPDEAQKILQHILDTYDHKTYFKSNPRGECEAPEILIPRAAIIAASYDLSIASDKAAAQKYAEIALDAVMWTFEKRTKEWLDAPKPEAYRFEEPGKLALRITYWEQHRADAAAGKALDPYAEELANAAVRIETEARAAQPADRTAILKSLAEKYPNSPISTAATKLLKP